MAAYTILAGEGCAGRLTSDRGVARSSLALGLTNRSGLGVPATPSGPDVRTARGQRGQEERYGRGQAPVPAG